MNTMMNRVLRPGIGLFAAGAILLSGLGTASAHVTARAGDTSAGAYTVLTFGVPHGCDGSATTQIDISIPDEIQTVKPGVHAGWTIETRTEESATPVATEHGETTEKTSEIIYTAKEPLPDAYYDQLLVQVKLPDDAAGQTIYFPTVQTCEEGETAWVQIPEEGQDPFELEHPAPFVTVTASQEDTGQ